MKPHEAVQAIRLLREAILGLSTIKDGEKVSEKEYAITAAYATETMRRAFYVLDLFLTGGVSNRESNWDVSQVSRFFGGNAKEARILLSDEGPTALVLRWPTKEDSRVLFLDLDESTDLKLRRRWFRLLDDDESEAVDFVEDML